VIVNWVDRMKAAGDGGFTVLPPGEYDVYVHAATGGTTSTGKDRIRVTFKVENGPQAGQIVVNDFVISEDSTAAMGIFFRHMTVLGADKAYFTANPTAPVDAIAAHIQSHRARCRLRTSTREWQGQTRTNVDAILPPPPGTATQAPPPPAGHTVPATPTPHAPHHTPSGSPPVPQVPVPSMPELPDDLPF
jgi:hypothetical protein